VGIRLQPSLRRIMIAANNLKFGQAAVDDVSADVTLIESGPDLPQRPDPVVRPLRDRISVDHVTFHYEGADLPALHDVSLVLHKGTALGICGPTGGGKSTFVDVIVGLLRPTTGRVLVDGRDIHDELREWQQQLGVVSQSVFLLDASLRQNVALGVAEREIDQERVVEAIRLAQLEDFVDALPDGLDTEVGERGVRISGGQRQRVAIARALYRRPSVLVFDEATSALDTETEGQLVTDLERLRGERTLIMVAHRLSTVRYCDRIVVVEDGRISDAGTFDELARRHKLFADFAPG
jgi:ATP-binding cassette, subfamily B, bacterial PglK